METPALACVIGAIPKEQRGRYDQLKRVVIKKAITGDVEEHESGFTYSLHGEPNTLSLSSCIVGGYKKVFYTILRLNIFP